MAYNDSYMGGRIVEYKPKNVFKRIWLWLRGLSKLKLTALILMVLILCLGSAGALILHHLSDIEGVFEDIDWGGGKAGETEVDIGAVFTGRKIINIALLGHDHSESRSKTRLKGYTGLVDTIMVAAINIESGEVSVVSIPRDSYVSIYNHGNYKDKINSANYWGWSKGLPGIEDPVEAGIISQVETISQVLGDVPIHFYVSVDMDMVVEVVDIIGGVWYDVPERTYHNHGRIIAEPGYQLFSGKRFLDYIRSRVAGGDYQRTKKQQDVMIEFFSQLKQANKLTDIPKVLLTANKKTRTNLTLEQLAALALFGARKIDPKDITPYTLEGKLTWGAIPGRAEGNNYYLIDHKKRALLIEEVWNKTIEPGPADTLLPVKKKDAPSDDGSGEIGESTEQSQ